MPLMLTSGTNERRNNFVHHGRVTSDGELRLIHISPVYAWCVEAGNRAVDRMIEERDPIKKLARAVADKIDPVIIESMRSMLELHDEV